MTKTIADYQAAAVAMIEAERVRAAAKHRASADDQLDARLLSGAAMFYWRRAAHAWQQSEVDPATGAPMHWPLDPSRWQPGTVVNDLLRAGALFLSEADRADRVEATLAPEQRLGRAQPDGMARDAARLLSLILRDRDERDA